MIDDAVVLRAIERILAVAIGGLCIYLGHRLFLQIPAQKEGEGKVEFPGGISVYVARVGPGVFFALFGAALVAVSFYRGIDAQTTRQASVATTETRAPGATPAAAAMEHLRYKGAGGAMGTDDRTARADRRALLRKEFAVLNTLPGLVRRDLPAQDRNRVELSTARIKLALMKPMWGDPSEGWGDPVEFEQWVEDGEREPAPAALKAAVDYYRQGARPKP